MLALIPALVLSVPVSSACLPSLDENVVLVLEDGSELAGTTSLKSVEIETDFGSADVDVDRIATIEFGEPDVIETRGGARLTGEVNLRSIKIEVDGKKSTVKSKSLARWIGVEDGKRLDAMDIAGEWMTSFGPMTLEQSGRTVTGTYGFDETSLSGTVMGNSLEITYGSGGSATFEVWPDGNVLTGDWTNGERSGGWAGYAKAPLQAEPSPGEIVTGQTESGLRYHLRVPTDYDPDKTYDAICILHGSNMTAKDYVATIAGAWPELADDYVVVGFDGEKMNAASKPDAMTFNYSYINFGGHEVGPPFAHRQSPALVAEGLEQLQSELGLGRWFVGGHSQGAWLTYPVVMFYPELVAGAFPVSGGMLVQCEPTSFDDLDEQREIAFAPVHGTNDGVVAFSSGEAGVRSLTDGGFPALHFFTDDSAAHMFARLPVDDAIRWLDRMSSGDADELAELAMESVESEQWRDATAAVRRAEGLDASEGATDKLERARKAIDKASAKQIAKLEPLVKKNADGSWVDEFLAFREDFAFAPSAKDVMEAYAQLREEHQKPADDLFWKQRSEQDKEAQEEMRRRIVDEYYASSWYEMVKGWLDAN